MKYIDAEKLLAVLERQNVDKKIIQPLIRIIDYLQEEQQEDLEKDFSIAWARHPIPKELIPDLLVKRGLREFIYKTAHYFYELGKNSK